MPTVLEHAEATGYWQLGDRNHMIKMDFNTTLCGRYRISDLSDAAVERAIRNRPICQLCDAIANGTILELRRRATVDSSTTIVDEVDAHHYMADVLARQPLVMA